MNNDINQDNIGSDIPQRAVSIYGQGDAMDDFPVLKAFQQYIDAEQEKSRKRLMTLGMIFGAVLIAVIVVFMFLMQGINQRNQDLSDRLVEYVMKESARHQQAAQQAAQTATPVVQANPQNDAALKAMTDTLVALQKKIEEKPAVQTAVEPTADPKLLAEQEKILRAKAQLEEQKKELAAEKERLRQIEIDRQRRKLYPELYGEEPAQTTRKTPSRRRTLTDEDIEDILREAYPESTTGESQPTARMPSATRQPDAPVKETAKPATEEKSEKTDAAEDDDAIEYFKDDEYKIPVDVKNGKSVRFTLPVQ